MPRARRISDFHPELGLPEVRKLWQTESLFSDHYLKKRIRENSWWPTDGEAQSIWEFCKELYEKRYVTCAKNNEAFTRQELIDKILERLGFAWTDNLGLPETRQDLEPDYILFANKAEKEAVIEKDAAQRYRAAISLLEAKKVNHPLSQISKRQQRYPHQQIRDYLNEAQVLNWGILTNGNEWRLYCRDAKPSQFFAIDFGESIKSLENFKFFVALFCPTAFVGDASGKSRLDHVRESALAAQSELEEDLRQRVFVLVEILANGFAERPENEISDTDLAPLYDACLIFLYRLLFILYAEGRQLLPVEPKSRKYYNELSLARLVTPLKNFSEHDSRTRTHLYEVILELCNLINGTDEKKNIEYSVPRYNGGLFAPERHLVLEKWRVSDAVLADVLRGLMFNPQPERDKPALPIETVDFGDLRVQQLGSIYEGLLEHHFVRDGARLVLKTDKAERKATGTYYTPDYIVKYIVEQTVGPFVAEIDERELVKKARAAGLKDNSFAREALGLNVLDPAMGSGHFLVEATTFLADEIAGHPTTQPLSEKSKDEDEIAHWRRRVVESCIYGVDLNPLAVELAKLSLWLTTIATDQPLNFLDHHFCCGNSLIGARLEDLREVPELKKKKHDRLKLGWKGTENLRAALQKAVRFVEEIEEKESKNVDAVKNKEKLWSEKARPALEPFRAVANLWTSCFFGNRLPQLEYEALIELLDVQSGKPASWKSAAEFQEITSQAIQKGALRLAGRKFEETQLATLCARLRHAGALADTRKFFHWEFEFPEVFFNEDGTPREAPGFDAVIGNPPWIGHEISELEPHIGASCFSLFDKIDTYLAFFDKALTVVRLQGSAGFITPNTYFNNRTALPLRQRLVAKRMLRTIVDLPKRTFKDAPDVYPCITILSNSSDSQGTYALGKGTISSIPSHFASIAYNDLTPPNYYITAQQSSTALDSILRKIEASQPKLSQFAAFQKGIETGSDAKHLKQFKKPESGWLPWLHGREIGPYEIDSEGWYVHYGAHLKNPQSADLRISPKIVIQYIRKLTLYPRVVAAFDNGHFFPSYGTLVSLIPNGKAHWGFLLALLNSNLINRFYQQRFHDIAVKRDYLYKIPIAAIDFTTPAAKRATQLENAKRLYEKSLAAGDLQDALYFVEAELQARRTDVVHDLLAFLAVRMMAMKQEKRTTAKQFLTDLKDFHNINPRALNPKTKLDEFWELEALDLFTHLHKNARRLEEQKVRLSEKDEDKIRSRFVMAKETLLPLENQIAFTDQLIDQIVYRLYGLAEREIKIVEGAN